jgi:NitT/TauT family transport system permease protein
LSVTTAQKHNRQTIQAAARRVASALAAPLITLLLVVFAWEGLVYGFSIPVYLLPAPSDILGEFFAQPGYLLGIGVVTFKQALGGFVIGCTLGALVAAVCTRWQSLADGLLPFAVASNAVPIVALAPLLGIWLGSTSPASKIAVVAVMTFFPTLINVFKGLMSPHPDALRLLHSYAAPQWAVFLKVRMPAALPFLFSALKMCAALSMIGAVVSEFFGGLRNSLGVYIKMQATVMHTREAWSAILVACLFGIGFYLVIVLAERLVIPWYTRREAQA